MEYTNEETGDSYMLFGNGGNGYNIVRLNEDMISWDADTMYHYPAGTFPGFRESIHRKMMTIAGGILRRRTKELSSKYPRRIF